MKNILYTVLLLSAGLMLCRDAATLAFSNTAAQLAVTAQQAQFVSHLR